MSLFYKYGGEEFWSDFLNIFYSRITISERLSPYFINKDIKNIKCMLLGLLEVTIAMNGDYPKELLSKTHQNMGISDEDLNEWIQIYETTLKELGVEEEDRISLLRIIENFRDCIVISLV